MKNSEQTAWSSAYFVEIVRLALAACRQPQDLVQAVSCWPQTAGHLSSHPGISHLTFIGSRPVAHAVAKDAAKTLTPLCVELGGKDAAIVLDDGNVSAICLPKTTRMLILGQQPPSASEMDRISSIIMRGVFQSAGQNCIGIERVVAMPKAYNILMAKLEPRIKGLRVGNDLDSPSGGEVDVGAMISPASFDRLERLVQDAVNGGARLLAGGKRYRHPQYPQASYFTPTLLVDVTPTMQIAQEELFAPICVLMRAISVKECISIANSPAFGLGCSVFGPTTSSAARRNLQFVAKEVRTGMVAINDFAAFYAVQLPFGGIGGSGYGRFAGEEGLRGLCNAKSVCVDRWPWAIKTAIPGKLDYPMKAVAWDMGRGVVEVGYGESLGRRVQGVRRMVGW